MDIKLFKRISFLLIGLTIFCIIVLLVQKNYSPSTDTYFTKKPLQWVFCHIGDAGYDENGQHTLLSQPLTGGVWKVKNLNKPFETNSRVIWYALNLGSPEVRSLSFLTLCTSVEIYYMNDMVYSYGKGLPPESHSGYYLHRVTLPQGADNTVYIRTGFASGAAPYALRSLRTGIYDHIEVPIMIWSGFGYLAAVAGLFAAIVLISVYFIFRRKQRLILLWGLGAAAIALRSLSHAFVTAPLFPLNSELITALGYACVSLVLIITSLSLLLVCKKLPFRLSFKILKDDNKKDAATEKKADKKKKSGLPQIKFDYTPADDSLQLSLWVYIRAWLLRVACYILICLNTVYMLATLVLDLVGHFPFHRSIEVLVLIMLLNIIVGVAVAFHKKKECFGYIITVAGIAFGGFFTSVYLYTVGVEYWLWDMTAVAFLCFCVITVLYFADDIRKMLERSPDVVDARYLEEINRMVKNLEHLVAVDSMKSLRKLIMEQILELLDTSDATHCLAAYNASSGVTVFYGGGRYSDKVGEKLHTVKGFSKATGYFGGYVSENVCISRSGFREIGIFADHELSVYIRIYGVIVNAVRENILKLYLSAASVALSRVHRNERLRDFRRESVTLLSSAVGDACQAVAMHSKRLAGLVGLSAHDCELLSQAAVVVYLSEHKQPVFGEGEVIRVINTLIEQGEEQYSGGGRNGLRAETISIYARIAHIVFAFVSETTTSGNDAGISLISQGKGTKFQPDLVDKFIDYINSASHQAGGEN